MTIGYEKAFGYLEFKHINKVLEYYSFGPMIRSWIKVIYKDINSCVINNGRASEFFNISRGLRQGCPLSPYLFIISVELMAENIQQDADIVGITINGIEYKISNVCR